MTTLSFIARVGHQLRCEARQHWPWLLLLVVAVVLRTWARLDPQTNYSAWNSTRSEPPSSSWA